MTRCVKCGCQIPDGELFCMECGLNPGSSLFEEPRPVPPVGRMQAPVTKSSQRLAPVAVKEPEKKKKNAGLKAALAVVSLLLVLSVGFTLWNYVSIKAEWTRLETKEADLLLREREKEELSQDLEAAHMELERLQIALEKKDSEIRDLQAQLSGVQNEHSQSHYDLYTMQTELDRLLEENKQLLLLEAELEANIKTLSVKAKFMDDFVVFAENDGSQVYHTYDCARFDKKNFWAYSRKLAEASGFRACSTCSHKSE